VRKQLRSEAWRPATGDETGEAQQLAVGDSVWLDDIRVWGTVLSLSDDEGQLEVQVGHTRLKLCMDDVGEVRPASNDRLRGQPVVGKKLVRRTPSLELDLRGRRADEIEPELDTYLNDASLAGLGRVRIIHGFGTGTVRQIVRGLLGSHGLVKSFRPGEQGEGGDGVTVVEL
jgi:DNA mismatch repair protein MutS2